MTKLVNNDGSPMKAGLSLPKNAAHQKRVLSELNKLELINPDKVKPLEYRVLVRVAEVHDISEGGIFIPEATIVKEMFSKTYATFIACGDEAFTDGAGDYIQNRPEKGDKILTSKYPGNVYRDDDNNLYRFCNDKDVVAILKGEK